MDKPGFFKRHIKWLLPLLLLLGAVLIFITLAAMREKPPEKPEADTAALVEVHTVSMAPLQLSVRSQGLVRPKYETELVAQVSGELVSVDEAFVRGGRVRQGDLLAEIDPTNYDVRLQEARAALASAEAALEQEEAQGSVARSEWENISDRPIPRLGLREPQLAQARAQVTAAQAALRQAEKDLSRTRITAPYDALITRRDVSPGTFVNVGAAIGQVQDLTTAEVRLPLANTELQYLQGNGVGAKVLLNGEAAGRAIQWPAQIVRHEGVIDQDTRMTYLVAEVRDPYLVLDARPEDNARVLPFGTYVVADIEGVQLPSATQIPRQLIKDGQVAVAQDGQLLFKAVEVLRSTRGASVVVDGIESGDQLITTPLEFPVEGMEVEVVEGEQQEPAAAPLPAEDMPMAEAS